MASEITEKPDLKGRILNKAGALTDATPYLANGSETDPSIGFQPTASCIEGPVRVYTDGTETTLVGSYLTIQSAIDEVLKTLLETLLIVVLVIFLFLGSVRSLIIPVVAIPISLVGAFFLMLVAGFTINLLTLLAIVLSVGLVVGDAIVMVENVERHVHEGKPPLEAALMAARELVNA